MSCTVFQIGNCGTFLSSLVWSRIRLRIAITTAGESTEGVWHEQREYSEQVTDGIVQDTSHLGIIFRAMEDDDIDSRETWVKANPSLGHTLTTEDFERDLAEAKLSPAKLQNFKRLRLNVICQGENRFVDMVHGRLVAASGIANPLKCCWTWDSIYRHPMT